MTGDTSEGDHDDADDRDDDTDSPFRDREPLDNDAAIDLLTNGELEILGRMPWSSNATLLCDLRLGDDEEPRAQAIYKPHRGERPLWDFPSGLYTREVAAYELSVALDWDLVPPTVVRDGPLGPGSLQLFIPADFDEHYFTLQDDPEHRFTFQRLCAFDVVANSTDRKSGHCLLGEDGRIHAIDNGLSFHVEFKLRTVLWDFADDPIPERIIEDLIALCERGLPDQLVDLLDEDEPEAAIRRARSLIATGRFPTDPTGRRWPWPLV